MHGAIKPSAPSRVRHQFSSSGVFYWYTETRQSGSFLCCGGWRTLAALAMSYADCRDGSNASSSNSSSSCIDQRPRIDGSGLRITYCVRRRPPCVSREKKRHCRASFLFINRMQIVFCLGSECCDAQTVRSHQWHSRADLGMKLVR
jgi:hypothetical protein